MPIITLAPILADPIDNSRQSSIEINPFLFVKGSHVYQVLADANAGKVAVFKATAAGANSAALDSVNAPAIHSAALVAYSNPGSGIITIAYWTAVGNLVDIINFDTATDTYGTPIVSTLAGSTAFSHGVGVFFRSGSGLYYVTYVNNGSGNLEYVTIDSGGATSSAFTVTAAESGGQGLFYTVLDEGTGIVFLFYLVSLGGGHFNCVTLSAADVAGTPVNITTDGVEWVEAAINSGTIYAAWINGNGTKVETSSATVAAAPTFAAATTLDTVAAPQSVTYISITFIASVLTVLWCLTDFSFDPGIDEINYSQFVSSAWTAPDVFYDAVANPPPGGLPYPSQFVHTLQVVSISNGWFGFTAMETGNCTGFILVAPGVAISIACPVAPLTATVGVLFTSDAPIVTNGTAPYTFTLVSGPLWMSIDSTTGVLSGTPTAGGSVTYTIKVTDSLGNTATVASPCPLTVNEGPPFCIAPPATGQENLVLVNEPLENQGT